MGTPPTGSDPGRLARDLASAFGLTLDDRHIDRLTTYLDLLLKWRDRVNLISEPSIERILRLHFLESFWLSEHFLEDGSALTDVGSGAGFPGLAAAVYRPSLHVALIERNPRKVVFLEQVIRNLNLPGASVFSRSWTEYQNWPSRGTVSIRALKTSPQFVERLAEQRQRVLLLHSSEIGSEWDKYNIIRELQVPLSKKRRATELAPAATSPEGAESDG